MWEFGCSTLRTESKTFKTQCIMAAPVTTPGSGGFLLWNCHFILLLFYYTKIHLRLRNRKLQYGDSTYTALQPVQTIETTTETSAGRSTVCTYHNLRRTTSANKVVLPLLQLQVCWFKSIPHIGHRPLHVSLHKWRMGTLSKICSCNISPRGISSSIMSR